MADAKHAHRKLNAAVFAAYGWPIDLSDDDVLARLLVLNLISIDQNLRGLAPWVGHSSTTQFCFHSTRYVIIRAVLTSINAANIAPKRTRVWLLAYKKVLHE